MMLVNGSFMAAVSDVLQVYTVIWGGDIELITAVHCTILRM